MHICQIKCVEEYFRWCVWFFNLGQNAYLTFFRKNLTLTGRILSYVAVIDRAIIFSNQGCSSDAVNNS